MKGSGLQQGNGPLSNRNYLSEDDWEVAEELTPDPFSEEEHTQIHTTRFSKAAGSMAKRSRDNTSKQEKSGDILA